MCSNIQRDNSLQLQRVGRTGRKREGYVHVLLAEGREETNWNKAREAYNQVQKTIVRGDQLELYDDIERLLPDHIKPECLEMVMEIQEYDRSATERSRENAAKGPGKKRKRNDDPARDIPPGACTGFVSVADLLVKQDKRRKKTNKFDENAGLDDETDEEIEAGLFAPRRSTSMSATSSKPPKTKLKRAKTMASGRKKGKLAAPKPKRIRANATELTPSQLAREGAEDSDDREIERGLQIASVLQPPKSPSPVPSGSLRTSSPKIPLVQNQSIIDICTSAASSRFPSPSYDGHATPQSPGNVLAPQHVLPSPASGSAHESGIAIASESYCGSDGGRPDRNVDPNEEECEPSKGEDSLAWLLADSDDPEAMEGGPSKLRSRMSKSLDSDVIAVEDSELEDESPIVIISSPMRPSRQTSHEASPAIPRLRPSAHHSPVVHPEPSLPVRAAGRAKKRLAVADSSSPAHPPLSQRRLRRRTRDSHSPSPPLHPPSPTRKHRRPKYKVRDTAAVARINPWIDVEAAHSGDEVSGGGESSALSEGGNESEGEGRFVTNLPATQVSPSYDQSAVYRQSLLSQAPAGPFSVPVFAAPPVRRGGVRGVLRDAIAAAAANLDVRNVNVARLSSPSQSPDEEDYYMLGSFVVDDEAEILSVMQSSEP